MDVSQIVAVAVFVVVMITIMTEKLHRSLAAITGAMIVLALHVMPFDAAMEHIDFNTLGVLLGMMLFVSVVKLSGVFEFLAIKCARLAKGDPWKIMLLFVLLTAVLSAFLDNVTTVLLIGPMTLTVCKLLDVNPIPFFMTEILASNIGGTATLIGDPPNIMIGSAAGYSFFDFIMYDAPAVAIILVAILGVFYALYGRKMNVDDEHKARIMELDEHAQIKNRRLLKQSVVMTALVVVGFMAHGALGLESCIIALGAAGIIMLISGESIEEALSNVEWTTLSFFAGLFVIVGALAETGVIGMLANGLINATGGNVFITMLVLLIGSAVIQLPGQHPVRGHDDPHPAGHGIHRHGRHAAVVGRVAGRLPGRQRHAHRRQRQRGAVRHQQEARVRDHVREVLQDRLPHHAAHHFDSRRIPGGALPSSVSARARGATDTSEKLASTPCRSAGVRIYCLLALRLEAVCQRGSAGRATHS